MAISYRSSKWTLFGSILHMVGQMQDMQMAVKVSDIATWCEVSKQTAKRYVLELMMEGLLKEQQLPYRGNIHINYYHLSLSAKNAYKRGEYKPQYRLLVDSKEIPF